jgi:hypothetical protein
MDKRNGLVLTSYDNRDYNACGKRTSDKDNTCIGEIDCVLYDHPGSYLKKCTFNEKINIYMNHNALLELLNNNNCSSYLNYFNSNKCNSVILCYIDYLTDIYTLNHNIFNFSHDDNALTVQKDVMSFFLNNKENGLLNYFRNIIYNNCGTITDKFKALSFTNIIENNTKDISNVDTLISECINTCQEYMKMNDNKNIKDNQNLFPQLWQINYEKTNSLNLCNISLSTSENYKTVIKYAEFNDNKTNLSIYPNGIKQKLNLENVNVIADIDTINNNKYVAITTNLISNDGLYLVPSFDSDGFTPESKLVKLSPSLPTGKWLILGFSLNKISDLKQRLNDLVIALANNNPSISN